MANQQHHRLGRSALFALALPLAGIAGPDVSGVQTGPCFCPAPTQDAAMIWKQPPIFESENIRYKTGGIGKTEAALMKADRGNYPLALEFLVQDHQRYQYTSHVSVEILNDDGTALLHVTTQGPFLLADIPSGHYRVRAVPDKGDLQEKEVDVQQGTHKDLRFVWQDS